MAGFIHVATSIVLLKYYPRVIIDPSRAISRSVLLFYSSLEFQTVNILDFNNYIDFTVLMIAHI